MPTVTATDLASVMTRSESVYDADHAAHGLFGRPAVHGHTYAITWTIGRRKWNVSGVETRSDGLVHVWLTYHQPAPFKGYSKLHAKLYPTERLRIVRRRID